MDWLWFYSVQLSAPDSCAIPSKLTFQLRLTQLRLSLPHGSKCDFTLILVLLQYFFFLFHMYVQDLCPVNKDTLASVAQVVKFPINPCWTELFFIVLLELGLGND